jgi:myo-inositol-1(or 4)-monophosphatase
MGEPADPAELADLALQLGREAGALLRSGWGQVRAVDTKSSAHDLVTQMDRDSERLIRDRLELARPGDAVLGEEEGDTAGSADSGVRWIVDPLDGTVNYFYGQPAWAVSIAAEHHGRIVAGAVVAPGLRQEYVAAAGQGAWAIHGARRERLRVRQPVALADALVATGFGYRPQRRACQGRLAAELLPRVRDIRRVGAAAVDLCWLAHGRFDGYYEQGLHYWDWAAGGLVAAEAGAVVADAVGGPASPRLTVAAPRPLYEELAAVLRALGAGECP